MRWCRSSAAGGVPTCVTHVPGVFCYRSPDRSRGALTDVERTPPRSTGIPRSMRVHPRLVEQERDSEHDEKESEIHKREAPSTTSVEAISELELSLLFQRRHSQIDQDRGAHHQETEVQEPVYQR